MATKEDLRAALDDYVQQALKNERVQRSLGSWHCIIYVEATDIGAGFTMAVRGAGNTSVVEGSPEPPDLIVRGASEDLTNIFWCDENPAGNYMQGAIKIQGSPENTMKLDAMALLIFLEVSKTK